MSAETGRFGDPDEKPVEDVPTQAERELIEAARAAREAAYRPYSGFAVGAALRDADGRVFTGCNIENSSSGLTVCAERVAVWRAISEGSDSWVEMAVVADSPDPTPPCGACLQVLSEFVSDMDIVLSTLSGRVERFSLKDLLPKPFLSPKSAAALKAAEPTGTAEAAETAEIAEAAETAEARGPHD